MKAGKTLLNAALACVGAALLLLMGACTAPEEQASSGSGFGLFSWNSFVMSEEEAEALDVCIRQADVKRIYQEIPAEHLEWEETSGFVRRMSAQSVEVYALIGSAEWAYERDGGSLIHAMSQIAAYNKEQEEDAQIAGVMVDVEPYLLDEWDEGGESRTKLMKRYLSGIKAGYQYALEYGLEFWVCIPIFYDSTCADIMEELIAEGCDGVAVMNYNRTDEYMQMAKEVGCAREYQKGVVCIYELQEPGKHDLEEINTYAEVGLPALWESAQRLERQFGYEGLQFAYHYYKPLQELLQETNAVPHTAVNAAMKG